VTAVAAAPVRLAVDRSLQRSKVEIEYEHEQRKAIREKIGAYHGRLLEAALNLHYRLVNLATNVERGWLDTGGNYQEPLGSRHYFRTTAYRFVLLAGLANKFERDAIFIDARFAEGTDESFLFYAKAFRWVMTDAALFKGLEYDDSTSTDHFFTDHLRHMCSVAWTEGQELDFAEFEQLLVSGDELTEVLSFFDGMRPGDLRWDRLVALQLLLMAFINTFGYAFQESDDDWFRKVAGQIQQAAVARNLLAWLPKLGLAGDPEAERLTRVLAAVEKSLPS
jgi:hypothetical protein